MIWHYIIMSSSYTDGVRIALDFTKESDLNSEAIAKIIQEIKQKCGEDVPLSTHFIVTESDSWASVAEYDPYFEDVVCIKSVFEFCAKINKSRVLTGMDVANYILSKIKCTHPSLEKLVYFAYADYLCEYSKRLFEDRIYAFIYGPVVASVYDTYKRSGYQYINSLEFGSDNNAKTIIKEMPARCRILFAKDGCPKLHSIDLTIEKYGKYSAKELDNFTHRAGSPWSHIDCTNPYLTISDELISKYHYIECV